MPALLLQTRDEGGANVHALLLNHPAKYKIKGVNSVLCCSWARAAEGRVAGAQWRSRALRGS